MFAGLQSIAAMSQQAITMSDELREEYINWWTYLAPAEMIGSDIAGYWLPYIPFDEDLRVLRHELGKMAYDEVRHSDISVRMLRHVGGQEAVDSLYSNQKKLGMDSYLHMQGRMATEGYDDFIEYLVAGPTTGDFAGIPIFADIAECSPDPLISDAAESIAEDEKLHANIGAEFLPMLVDKFGEPARESIQRALDRWMPVMLAHQGYPDSKHRQRMIDSGMMTLSVRDIHEKMYQELEEIMNPLGIEVPVLDESEYLHQSEIKDYSREIIENKDEEVDKWRFIKLHSE